MLIEIVSTDVCAYYSPRLQKPMLIEVHVNVANFIYTHVRVNYSMPSEVYAKLAFQLAFIPEVRRDVYQRFC